MVLPMLVDIAEGNGHWPVFAESALITALSGGLIALACANGVREGLSIQQTFLLTTVVWVALPIFGALPFVFGGTEARFVDAFFEAMSGLTTTGSTVFSGLETLPRGLLLWRGILQWLGGIGIIVVAMVFLPELRVGGMQIFKTEAFDTLGKILPRATQIAGQISAIYLGLTVICMSSYAVLGMPMFEAVVHALTTVSTGGFSTSDASFGAYSGVMEYAASLFMILAALPAIGTLVGFALSFGPYRYFGMNYFLVTAIAGYIIGLGILYLMGIIANALSPSFDGTKNDLSAMKLVVYSATPMWIAGFFNFIPGIGFLFSLVGFGYAAYLLYLGSQAVMKVPENKAVGYTAVTIIIWVVLSLVVTAIIIGALVSAFIGTAALTGAAAFR